MNKTYLIAIAAALMAAPMVMAHEPRGTYKTYCEPSNEWLVHEYGPPASGNLISGYEDGNLADCDGSGVVVGPTDTRPCPDPMNPWDEEIHLPLPAPDGTWVCFDRIADYDGHAEYSRGGAWILSVSGNGEPSADPSVGAGSLYCFGDLAHHANPVTATVDDLVLGAGVDLTVAADTEDITGIGEGCGDFESDRTTDGTGTVTATFSAGLDGTYQVYVRGTQGHITTN